MAAASRWMRATSGAGMPAGPSSAYQKSIS